MNNSKFVIALLTMLLISATATAGTPALPGYDIWKVGVSDGENGGIDFTKAEQITTQSGYDNQPYFINDLEFLYTSSNGGQQTDAWRYSFSSKTTNPVLATPESEYSPQMTPRGEVAVVRVDASSVQQLAIKAVEDKSYKLLFPQLEQIGYQTWLNDNHVAMFIINGDKGELHIADRDTGDVVILSYDIGRCLQVLRDGSLLFVENDKDGNAFIKQLVLSSRKLNTIAPVLEGSQDFRQLPNGKLLMAKGKSIFQWDGKQWVSRVSFNELPGNISRLASNPLGNTLLMVVEE